MPTYDYRCDNCRRTFEKFQAMTDRPIRKCPVCGKSAVKRLIGNGTAIIFKGSGFYQTDYRSADYKKRAKDDTSTVSTKDSTKEAGSKGGADPSDA